MQAPSLLSPSNYVDIDPEKGPFIQSATRQYALGAPAPLV